MTKPSLSDFSQFADKPKPVKLKLNLKYKKTVILYEYYFIINSYNRFIIHTIVKNTKQR